MGGRTSWAEKKKQHEGKLDAPVNHMIDVASYWAYACQKTADLRHFRRSWLSTSLNCIQMHINHYPVDSTIGFHNTYPLDMDLSSGQRHPSFEQPGPVLWQIIARSRSQTPRFFWSATGIDPWHRLCTPMTRVRFLFIQEAFSMGGRVGLKFVNAQLSSESTRLQSGRLWVQSPAGPTTRVFQKLLRSRWL